jgi:hypothetical protein
MQYLTMPVTRASRGDPIGGGLTVSSDSTRQSIRRLEFGPVYSTAGGIGVEEFAPQVAEHRFVKNSGWTSVYPLCGRRLAYRSVADFGER